MSFAETERKSLNWLRVSWPALVLLIVLVLLCEIAVVAGWVSALVLPRPSGVAASLFELVSSGRIFEHVAATSAEALIGFAIGGLAGFLLAVGTSMSTIMRRATYPYVIGLHVTPMLAIAPLIVAWLGFGYESKIAVAGLICFFPVFVNTVAGFASVDPTERELFRSLRATKMQAFLRLELPSALPLVFAGLKLAITIALVGAVVGEFISAERGLGLLVTRFSYQLAVSSAFAVVLTLTLIGIIFYGAVVLLERYVVYWRNDARLSARENRSRRRRVSRADVPRKLAAVIPEA